MNTTTIEQHPRTFSIYQANGKRKEGLKKAFVEVIVLNDKGYIRLSDNSEWPVFFEDGHYPILACKYIISFQVYENGDYFAVARLYKPKDTKLKVDNYGNAI